MTLNALSWATNTNYSTGPDVGTPTKVDPASSPNGFVAGVIAAPQHVNYLLSLIADELLKAVDGEGGGTYELSDPLEFQGEAVRFAGAVEVLGTGSIDVASGGVVTINGSGYLDLAGGANLNLGDGSQLGLADGADIIAFSGSTIQVLAGATLEVGGDVDLASGANINLASGAEILSADGARIQLHHANDLEINNSTFGFRLTLTPVSITAQAGVPDYQPFIGSIPTWLMHDATAAGWIIFAVPLLPGDTLTSLIVNLQGQSGVSGHSGTPETPPRVQLFEVDEEGLTTTIDTADDSETHPDYDSPHTITLSGGLLPYVATTNPLYVRIRTEGGANAEADKTQITSITGVGVATRYRGVAEIY